MDKRLAECAVVALTECLNLGRQEKLLVVCDPPCERIGRAFWEEGQSRCREAVLVQISTRRRNGNEPPAPTGSWFGLFDVAVMPTSKSLSHTQARRKASEKGTRVATLPGITEDVFLRTMKTDWEKLGIATRKIAGQLSGAKTIRVTSLAGTDLTFKTGGRQATADDGRLMYKGAFGNLPAGEAFLSPLENTAEGTLVIDGAFPPCGILKTPLSVTIKKGKVSEVANHPLKAELEDLFLKYGTAARNIAEFGVGTLDTARMSGNSLEDRKTKGTIHIAFGDNSSTGGTVKVPLHLDGIVRKPSVRLDGTLWMKDGSVL
jgi:leucyl aminopeptidase (aminopeptidase T)